MLFISKILFWVTCAYKIIVLSCLKIWRKKDCLLVVSFLPFIYFMIKIWDDSDSDPFFIQLFSWVSVFDSIFYLYINLSEYKKLTFPALVAGFFCF